MIKERTAGSKQEAAKSGNNHRHHHNDNDHHRNHLAAGSDEHATEGSDNLGTEALNMIKLISDKDGDSGDRATSYNSYSPCTWRAVNEGGETEAIFTQMKDPRFPRAQNATLWVGDGQSFTYLKEVRAHVKTMTTTTTKETER